jgi:hypothetical protein
VPNDLAADRNHLSLANGLLLRRIKHGGMADKHDKKDLARWIGLALAFSHEHMMGENCVRSHGAQHPYKLMNALIERVAGIAWMGQVVPDWAGKELGEIPPQNCSG